VKLAALDIAIIGAYLSAILYIALRTRRYASRNLENYFLDGRSMPGWMTGVSYAASMMSADSAVAYGGLAAITGAYVCWFYLSRFGIALFFGAVLFAVFWKRLNTFTTLEFYELRFTGKPAALLRLWFALRTSLIAMVAWTGISLLALVKLADPILGWGKTETLLAVIPLAVGYVYLAGYRGVVISNLLQVAVMIVGSAILAVKALVAAGGPSALGARLPLQATSLFPPGDDVTFPAVACIAWLIGTSVGYGGDAAPMGGAVEGQRILSSRSPAEACKMYIVAEVTLFLLVFLVSAPCLAAPLFWPELRNGAMDRELAYGLLMTQFLGPGLLGLVFVAMLGGVIAVIGDNLNFGSQVLLNDVYRRYLVRNASDRHYFLAGRASIFVILALALLVVYRVAFLFDVAIFMVGLSAAEMTANWAQWWWWRFNGWARLAASAGGAAIYIAIRLLAPELPWWTLLALASAATTGLWIAVSLVTPAEPEELLWRFHARVNPPGLWPWSRDFASIARGIPIALAGAGAVMAAIVALSAAYIGRNTAALACLGAAAVLALIFRRAFQPYLAKLT
jgi:Na+/proline symporter